MKKMNLKERFSISKDIIRFLLRHINRKVLLLYIIISLFSALTEIASIGLLFPLVDILVDSNKYIENETFYFILDFLNLNSSNYAATFILIFGAAITASYLSKIILIFLSAKITHNFGYNLSNKIFNKTIYKDYEYHTKSNTSKFLGNIEKVENTRGIGLSILDLIKSIILVFIISAFIISIEPKIVISIFIILTSIFLILSHSFKSSLDFFGKTNAELVNERFKVLQESTYNLKDTIIRNIYEILISKFDKVIFRLKNIRIRSDIISSVPHQGILLIASLILIVLIYYLSDTKEGLTYHLSFLAGITLAIQRLLPNFQNIFSGWVSIKLNYPSLIDVSDLINSKESEAEILKYDNKLSNTIKFSQNLKIENLNFSYIPKYRIFDNASIEIKKGKSYGITGPSGVGKSTFIDLITGLIKPDAGKILIDNKVLNYSNITAWQKKISFVPQDPIMLDSSVFDNIVFNEGKIENALKKVEVVTKNSESYDFIERLDEKLETTLGERGIRISGGQKQRISIARALFRDFEILILDESTSAIDSSTEEKIFNNILNFYKDKLILIISHRKSIYDKLDHLIEVKNGKIELLR